MATNKPSDLLAGLPNMATTPPSAEHVKNLLGLHRAGARIPSDFACWVLTSMPPSAALSGLGLFSQPAQRARHIAELNGYIRSCDETERKKGACPIASCIEINDRVTNYIDQKGYCTGNVLICWKSCAVGALIRAVQGGVNLADLSESDENRLVLGLVDVMPDWGYKIQPLGVQQAGNYSPDAEWNPAVAAPGQPQGQFMDARYGGFQPAAASEQQQQGPCMAGGISVFDLSHLPEPNHAGLRSGNSQARQAQPAAAQQPAPYSPGSASLYHATPPLGNPIGSQSQHNAPFSPLNSGYIPQSPFSVLRASGYTSMTSPQSPTPSSTLLPPHFPVHFHSGAAAAPSRSLSPLASGIESLHMGPAPNHLRSHSPSPTTPSYQHSRLSPAPSFASSRMIRSNTPLLAVQTLRQEDYEDNDMHDDREPMSPTSHVLSGSRNDDADADMYMYNSPAAQGGGGGGGGSQHQDFHPPSASPSPDYHGNKIDIDLTSPADRQTPHQAQATAYIDLTSPPAPSEYDGTTGDGHSLEDHHRQTPSSRVDAYHLAGSPDVDVTSPRRQDSRDWGHFHAVEYQDEGHRAQAGGEDEAMVSPRGTATHAAVDDDDSFWGVDDSRETPQWVLFQGDAMKRLPNGS
ncbi:hypothetical protein NKR19_g6537 [Coniochaeta hoffmannii]|uniref:Uncharacterized protein n=1 Tax=Coniochaeta hoffmannii TaxID=91930 RepID=A0AA38RXL7_9PEZI|nr:hypothetical protein NKR19_g6537 [Coniochaeta hoffmannii]